jgi:hypothetical protein
VLAALAWLSRPLLFDTGASPDGLTGLARLSGVVITDGGAVPPPGIRVALLDAVGDVVAVASMDSDGRYVLDGLPEGDYTAVADGFPPAVGTLRITAAEDTIRHDLGVTQPAE